ncbi:MAG: MotA/TolQ/ExbB proton channel family protein [Pseudomonadota bacterium]|nr:MotA/TolQ/ExbB proton channel family protein [Pseudomonadota bacterium]
MKSFITSILALVGSVVIVHLAYVGYIRPEAYLILEAAQAAGQSAPRALPVILKDYEQEICFILMFWGCFLMGGKCVAILKDRYLFQVDLLGEADKDGKLDLTSALNTLEELPERIRNTPLFQTLLTSLRRYLITKNVQDTSDTIVASVDALGMKLEAENSMIRYLIWAIPSIGFIGTVRGIGEALSQADKALAGDISGMTNSLGVAFNSTFVALLISIFLMFLLHQLQRLQDGLVVDTQEYCESFLLKRVSGIKKP